MPSRCSRKPSLKRQKRLISETLEPRYLLDSTVVINEIMYHPADTEEQLEWVELYNQLSVDLDLSGWTVRGGIDFDFPEGSTIGGGEYLVVARSPDQLAVASGFGSALGPYLVGQRQFCHTRLMELAFRQT